MGVVYEAFDRQRDTVVALKTLRSIDGPTLYRFKREFRALADISHRNLVTLYELIAIDGEWLFTMECVLGRGFLAYVRPNDVALTDKSTVPPIDVMAQDDFETVETAASATPLMTTGAFELDRLRAGMRELCEGVAFLHSAGRLHRDLKPSNVMVENDTDRVIVCDFGLVAELSGSDPYETASDKLMGTIAYMSPEQAMNAPLTEASDWYSVGIMLYQCMTGEVPFARNRRQLLDLKCSVEPPSPRSLNPALPEDLNQLCVDLLRLGPTARPDGNEVLRRLGSSSSSLRAVSAKTARPFVGRRRQLEELRAAYDRSRRGEPITAYVRAPSGMGKTSLAVQFLDGLKASDDALVLSGRCFQNEALPYKAFDSLIDDLSSYLARLEPEDVSALLPAETAEIARLFPVLRRVSAISEPERKRFGIRDPLEAQRLAFAALRGILTRLAERGPLVLFIDDLQWADMDSATLLREVLRTADAPPVLLIATYRSEEQDSSPLLRQLVEDDEDAATATVTIDVAPLTPKEAKELAVALDMDATDTARFDAIGDESGGNPLLIGELVRFVVTDAQAPREAQSPRLSIDAMLRTRIEQLEATARELLFVAAVAGRPVPMEVMRDATSRKRDVVADVLVLESQSLLRRRGENDVEAFHDRVRETAIAMLEPAELQSHHHRVATALQRTGSADPEALVEHWIAAGERKRASAAAIPAAQQAMRALAFDRAARLYELALEQDPDADDNFELRVSLADALANAGRGPEAAAAYLEAAEQSGTAARQLEFEQKAALAYLRSGHIDDGVATLTGVMARVGFRLAPTPRRAVISLVGKRALLRLRGLRFKRRDESQVSAETLARIDACWTAAVGLGMVDTIRGAEFQTRHLLLALRAGEPVRVSRALALEVAYLSTTKAGRPRARAISKRAAPLVESLGRTYDEALHIGVVGFTHYMAGEFAQALPTIEKMLPMLRAGGLGASWETATCELYQMWTAYYLGRIRFMNQHLSTLRRESARRGDAYAGCTLRTGFPAVATLLAHDSRTRVEQLVRHGEEMWSNRGFHLQHHWAIASRVHADLYFGNGEQALTRCLDEWSDLRSSFLLRVDLILLEVLHQRARAYIAASASGDRQARLRAAEKDATQLERADVPALRALGTMVRGLVAASHGDDASALALLADAEERLGENHLALFYACTRLRRGQILGGDEGAIICADAKQWMALESIANPQRAADMLAPIARETP